jgi:hypothetical protein
MHLGKVRDHLGHILERPFAGRAWLPWWWSGHVLRRRAKPAFPVPKTLDRVARVLVLRGRIWDLLPGPLRPRLAFGDLCLLHRAFDGSLVDGLSCLVQKCEAMGFLGTHANEAAATYRRGQSDSIETVDDGRCRGRRGLLIPRP